MDGEVADVVDLIEPLDVVAADDQDLADFHRLTVAAFAVDRPDAAPPTLEAVTARLRTPFTHFKDQRVRAARRDGRLVGAVLVQIPEGDNDHLAVVEVRVHPRLRRQGIGSALLGSVLPELSRDGRRRILGEGVTAGGDGAAWARALGFVEVGGFVLQVLTVADVDPARWEVPVPDGYRLWRWDGTTPDELLASYAATRGAMAGAPAGDTTYQVPQWTSEVVREAEDLIRSRGVQRRVVAAVHGASGAVAGLTEIELYPDRPADAVQGDTVVAVEHRGQGLGRCLKAAMMRRLVADLPTLRKVVTNTATDNTHMVRVNLAVGYRTTRSMVDVEADVAVLAAQVPR